MSSTTVKRRISGFRSSLIFPAEHGSWSWLLVPFLAGSLAAGRFALPQFLTLAAGLSVFFLRQPAAMWLRVRRGRGRRADGPPALRWSLLFGLIAALCTVGLLAVGRGVMLWLAVPLLLILVLSLAMGSTRQRTLWMEVMGAAALALMAPAAAVAATGVMSVAASTLWGIMALQNVLGALYVRMRIFDTHRQTINRRGILLAHAAGLALIVAGAAFALVPAPAALPFAAFLGRAMWAAAENRPVANVKRFGFAEMGIEIFSGTWIGAAYLLA